MEGPVMVGPWGHLVLESSSSDAVHTFSRQSWESGVVGSRFAGEEAEDGTAWSLPAQFSSSPGDGVMCPEPKNFSRPSTVS